MKKEEKKVIIKDTFRSSFLHFETEVSYTKSRQGRLISLDVYHLDSYGLYITSSKEWT